MRWSARSGALGVPSRDSVRWKPAILVQTGVSGRFAATHGIQKVCKMKRNEGYQKGEHKRYRDKRHGPCPPYLRSCPRRLSYALSAKILFRNLMAAYARSPCFKDIFLVRGRALVVLLSPDEVPRGGDDEEGEKDDAGVVHEDGRYGDGCRHAEEGDREDGPCCLPC